jgi:hypothetical protein
VTSGTEHLVKLDSLFSFVEDLIDTNILRRRLARRGGVKRISGQIYEDVRQTMKVYLERVSPVSNIAPQNVHSLTSTDSQDRVHYNRAFEAEDRDCL